MPQWFSIAIHENNAFEIHFNVTFIRISILGVIPQKGGRVNLAFLKYSTCHLESNDTPFVHIMTFNDNVSVVFSKKSDQNANFDLK